MMRNGHCQCPGFEEHELNPREEEVVGRRIDDIRTRLAGLERELAVLERWPDDDFADGTVLTFTKTFNVQSALITEERDFSYAAIKAVGVWYLTSSGNSKSGQELREVWVMQRNCTVEQAARMHAAHLAVHDPEAQARFDAAPEV